MAESGTMAPPVEGIGAEAGGAAFGAATAAVGEVTAGTTPVVDAAGAAGVAALLAEPGAFEPPIVVVLSGGNIDPLLLSKLLRHGLSAAGRFLGFRCRVPDYPGSLAALLGLLAELGANVLEVSAGPAAGGSGWPVPVRDA
jgi:hypothetical protein